MEVYCMADWLTRAVSSVQTQIHSPVLFVTSPCRSALVGAAGAGPCTSQVVLCVFARRCLSVCSTHWPSVISRRQGELWRLRRAAKKTHRERKERVGVTRSRASERESEAM